MGAAFEDAKVTGYEKLVPLLTNDLKNRHVLAAAIRCQAHAIWACSGPPLRVCQSRR